MNREPTIFLDAMSCVMQDYAEAHPTCLTNPASIRFFVYFNKRYYPVTSIQYYGQIATVHVNQNVWCLDPSTAPSGYTGRELEKAPAYIESWICPELYYDTYSEWKYSCGQDEQFLPFRQRGVLILDMYEPY